MFHKSKFAEIFKRLTLKKVVLGRGHDGGGIIADVYWDKKKVGEFHDDGRGGEPEMYWIDKTKTPIIYQYLRDNNAAVLINESWGKSLDDKKSHFAFSDEGLFDVMVEKCALENEENKTVKRNQLKAILFTEKNNSDTIKSIKFGNVTLTKLVQIPGGLKKFQETYDGLKKEEVTFLNPQEVFEGLGLKI